MRLMRIGAPGEETVAVSADGITAWEIGHLLPPGDDGVLTPGGLAVARRALENPAGLVERRLDEVRIASPLARPGKIVCVGLNYRRHAAEAGMAVPAEPILFMKAPDTVGGPHDDVVIPPGSVKTDYEVELAVVIGDTVRALGSPEEALAHVAGYAVADDVSEREFQLERGGQWDKGKNAETFSPLGPFLVTADEVPDPQALRLRTRIDGEVRQDSSTADMIFPVAHLVRYASRFMTLFRGDVILTGTPEGVGSGFAPPRFLAHGSVAELEIEGLGVQRHRFVAADSAEARSRLAAIDGVRR